MEEQAGRDGRRHGRAARGFLAGLLVGAATVLVTNAPADQEAGESEALAAVLYAISQLAVDTEQNAKRIVELADRIDRLEQRVEDEEAGTVAAPGKAAP